jgi:hypothetical protein
MQTSKRMRVARSVLRKILPLVSVGFLVLAAAPLASGQQQEQSGIESGNYIIKQSIEFGGRIVSTGGSRDTYNTFVNLQEGARLLDFTTEMTSKNHQGLLFDRLFFSNFGYGGDPNNVSILRVSKDKWYNFDAQFRRDINAWDYSLLANPLNPTTPTFVNAPAGFTPIISQSPHSMDTVRRMSDVNLTLLPQSRIRVRLGYSRNIQEGPSFTTFHEGTEALLFQHIKTTVNSYRFGVDFKVLPKTNISYDQLFTYYKGDTGVMDQNQLFHLSNGVPVDIGVSLNAGANQPCAGTFQVTGFVNPACNAYVSYTTNGRTRTSGPTEQISVQSNYFHNWDISARASYTGGNMLVDGYNEAFTGLSSRNFLADRNSTGPVIGRRVAATADVGATWHVTSKLNLSDSFHFANYHNPAEWDFALCEFFSNSMLVAPKAFSTTNALPATCSSPAGATVGTPVHSSSSAADITVGKSSQLLKVDEKNNLSEAAYQFSQHFGARLGFRYRSRMEADSDFESATFVFFPSLQNSRALTVPFNVDANGNTVNCPVANNKADGTCIITPAPLLDTSSVPVHEYSGLAGLWAQPVNNWRISFDTEFMSADNAFTRISPRQTQEYRVRTKYRLAEWFTLGGSIRMWEGRNNVSEINNLQHNRAYGFYASFDKGSKTSLELGYDYADVFSQILICYTSSAAPAGLLKCPASTLVQQVSTYMDHSHFIHFTLMVRPAKHLTARLGSNITVTNGSALLLTPNAPPGTLNSHYYQPYAGLDYDFAKRWTARANWGYYGYNEGLTAVPQDQIAPRNFRSNLETLSLRYAF